MPKMIPNHALATSVMDAVGDTMDYLYSRWHDEQDYEDIKDYMHLVVEALKDVDGVEVLSMTKRPFGFKWKGSDGGLRHTTINSRVMNTQRIG